MKSMRCTAKTILATAVLAGITCCYSNVFAFQQDKEDAVRRAQGRLISEGQNKTAVGPRKLLTYKLEELDLPQPKEIRLRGKKHQVTTVLRLTIKGEIHQPDSVIWIDDVLFPNPWEAGPTSIATLIYDSSLLRDGAQISVGSGAQLYDLPERLKLPSSFKSDPDEEIEDGNRIVAVRWIPRITAAGRERLVSIEITTARPLPVANSAYSLQIGRRFFSNLNGADRQWRLELSAQEFSQLKDGARVAVTVGPFSIAYLGRLEKKMLDR